MIRYEIDGEEFIILTQRDFYPPEDDRRYMSRIEDVLGEDEDCCDEYYDYAKMFWSSYGEDLYEDPLSYRF